MLHTHDNPDGPLSKQDAARTTAALVKGQDSFYRQQMTEFFSANGELKVSEAHWAEALAWCAQASKEASLACIIAWGPRTSAA